jgi:hypothetical protein
MGCAADGVCPSEWRQAKAALQERAVERILAVL